MQRKMMRVVGMARSGIHAVSEWLRMSHAEMGYDTQFDNLLPLERPNDIARLFPVSGDKSEPFLWMIEHEDQMLIDLPTLSPKLHNSFEFYDVMIIRDVFNTMASRKKHNEKWAARRSIQLWKTYAFEALNKTNFLGPNKKVINFNKWHAKPYIGSYREEVAKEFGITDLGSDTSKQATPGSSWDKLTVPVADMKLFDRWKNYADVPEYWSLFDKQAYDLNTALFGVNEGVLKYRPDFAE